MSEFVVNFCKTKAAFKNLWNTNYRHLDTLMNIVTHFLCVTVSEQILNGFNV